MAADICAISVKRIGSYEVLESSVNRGQVVERSKEKDSISGMDCFLIGLVYNERVEREYKDK